jgi:hypothetical protein
VASTARCRRRPGHPAARRAGRLNAEGYPDKRWPRDGKHYRVALAQADGNFQLEKGLNRGDAGDLHRGGGVDAMAPGPELHPNTDGYQGGRITVTGHTFSAISASGPTMTFCLNGCGAGAPSTAGALGRADGRRRRFDRSRLIANWWCLLTDNRTVR